MSARTVLTGGAMVELYAMVSASAARPRIGIHTGLSCRTNDGAIVDAVVAAWNAAGYVVTYDVVDLGDIVQGDRPSRQECLPIAGAFASFSYAVCARLEAGLSPLTVIKGRQS